MKEAETGDRARRKLAKGHLIDAYVVPRDVVQHSFKRVQDLAEEERAGGNPEPHLDKGQRHH